MHLRADRAAAEPHIVAGVRGADPRGIEGRASYEHQPIRRSILDIAGQLALRIGARRRQPPLVVEVTASTAERVIGYDQAVARDAVPCAGLRGPHAGHRQENSRGAQCERPALDGAPARSRRWMNAVHLAEP